MESGSQPDMHASHCYFTPFGLFRFSSQLPEGSNNRGPDINESGVDCDTDLRPAWERRKARWGERWSCSAVAALARWPLTKREAPVDSGQAASSYSWMTPPRRSWRRTRLPR